MEGLNQSKAIPKTIENNITLGYSLEAYRKHDILYCRNCIRQVLDVQGFFDADVNIPVFALVYIILQIKKLKKEYNI